MAGEPEGVGSQCVHDHQDDVSLDLRWRWGAVATGEGQQEDGREHGQECSVRRGARQPLRDRS